ncbi:hypothetical protein [Hydrogenophaga sp. BPS33]|uniref:hypothetical protein n=1 Tax=Hydrogenophaga sp. BPS33 TaxID=2651974 RepID=UPI0013204D7B|nr:hypothetical protein [Hydrogenophaga sp. BPS33]QHE87689.1 hypothetical protein F9K07_23720 [Hydrogenophaga sp. BPS33]
MPTARALLLLMLLLGLSGLLAPPFAMAAVAPHGAPQASTVAAPHGAGARDASHLGNHCNGYAKVCVETDCSTCHAHGAAMALGGTLPPWRLQGSAPRSAAEHARTPPWRERPDRPQWAAPSDRG